MKRLLHISISILIFLAASSVVAQDGPEVPEVSPMPCDVGVADFTISDDEVNQKVNIQIDFPAAVKPGKKSLWVLPEIGATKKKSVKMGNLKCTELQCTGSFSFKKFEKADKKIGLEFGGGIAELHDKKTFKSKPICTMIIHPHDQEDDGPDWDHNDKLFCDWVQYDGEGFPLPPEQITEDSPQLKVTIEPGKGVSTVTAYNFDPNQALKGCVIQPDGKFKEIWSVNIYDLNGLGSDTLRSNGSLNEAVYGPFLTSNAWSEFDFQEFIAKNPELDFDHQAQSFQGGDVSALVSLGSYGGGKTYSSGSSSSSSNAQKAAKFTAKRKKVIKRQAKKRKKKKKKKKQRRVRFERFDASDVSLQAKKLKGIEKFQAPYVFSTDMSTFGGDTDRLDSADSLNAGDPCNGDLNCDPCAIDPAFCDTYDPCASQPNCDPCEVDPGFCAPPTGPDALPKDFIYVFYGSCPGRLKPNQDPFKVLRSAVGDQFCSPDQPQDGNAKCEPFVFHTTNIPQGIDPLSLYGDVCKHKLDFGADGTFVDTDIFIGGLPEGQDFEVCFDGRKLNGEIPAKLDPEYPDAPPGLAGLITDNPDGIPDFDPQHFHTFFYDTDAATVNEVGIIRAGSFCSTADYIATVTIGQLEEED